MLKNLMSLAPEVLGDNVNSSRVAETTEVTPCLQLIYSNVNLWHICYNYCPLVGGFTGIYWVEETSEKENVWQKTAFE